MNRVRRRVLGAVVLLVAPATATAQAITPAPSTRDIVVTVAPGPEYQAGGLARTLLGSGWRQVWLTPVDVPVFDMSRYAGGLEFQERGGGHQSITLHLIEEDGWREYRFRSVNKFPAIQAMPPSLRGTTAAALVQDNVSSLFPAAPLLVPPLLDAIDVLHVEPALYIMPDEPRLGVYQDSFAGMLGTVELSPQEAPDDEPGFAGSRKIKNAGNFLDDIRASRMHRLDEREFVAVRLVDFMINDTDRTLDNVRFARYGEDGDYHWRPLPRDRDRAFMDARGLLIEHVVRPLYPKLIAFGSTYSLEGLTYTSHDLDRRLLQRLTRRAVEEVALQVQESISDEVIERVIGELPHRWRGQTDAAARLREGLRARRDQLPAVALEFYEWLAGEVDVHGTDESDRASVVRHADGRVTVTIGGPERLASDGVEPFYQRTFLPVETNEVRIYLHDADDSAVITGSASKAIRVRVIGGGGDDVLADSAGGGATHFYDSAGDNEFVTDNDTRVSIREWVPPEQLGGLRLDGAWSPDWGGSTGWGPVLGYADRAGVIVGFGPSFRRYGFRRLPHHWDAGGSLLVGLGSGGLGVTIDADYRLENSPMALTLAARATQFEAIRFHGFGNDTPPLDDAEGLVDQDQIVVAPALVWHIGWRAREGLASELREEADVLPGLRPLVGRLEAGPVAAWSQAEPPPGSPFATEAARGRDAGGRLGARLGLELDLTGSGAVPDRGWTLQAELAAYPPLLDVAESFGTAAALGSAYLPLPGDGTHLALRAGSAFASGTFPMQHAPGIGGRETVRGYRWRRFTGETSAFGSAELRVPVGTLPLFVRWRLGVFGLADAGRVWYESQSQGGWHVGIGGGVWLDALGQAFSLAFARGEQNRVYLQRGVSF
ncbi:MAG: BamA/TamA family outer membrane protein [Longimicrobiales bacterium]